MYYYAHIEDENPKHFIIISKKKEKDVKLKLKEKFKKIKLCKIMKEAFDLILSYDSINMKFTLIENIDNIELSFEKDMDNKYSCFFDEKKVKDLNIIKSNSYFKKLFYYEIHDLLSIDETYVYPSYCKVKVVDISVDNYEEETYDNVFYITTKFKIKDDKEKCYYHLTINISFNNGSNNYWTFNSSRCLSDKETYNYQVQVRKYGSDTYKNLKISDDHYSKKHCGNINLKSNDIYKVDFDDNIDNDSDFNDLHLNSDYKFSDEDLDISDLVYNYYLNVPHFFENCIGF